MDNLKVAIIEDEVPAAVCFTLYAPAIASRLEEVMVFAGERGRGGAMVCREPASGFGVSGYSVIGWRFVQFSDICSPFFRDYFLPRL